jgi:hypothetical protein
MPPSHGSKMALRAQFQANPHLFVRHSGIPGKSTSYSDKAGHPELPGR